MATLGRVKRSTNYPTKGPNFTVDLCPKFKQFASRVPEAKVFYETSSYEKVRAKAQNVKASVDKCDVPPKFPNNMFLTHAVECVITYLEPTVKSDIGFHPQSDINTNTSAGFTYKENGINTKGEALESEQFKDLHSRDDHISVASIADKLEMLPEEDLNRDKVRTIFVDALDKLVKGKFFFDKQNKALIESHAQLWIKYGLTKQYGGFDRFVCELEKFSLRDQSDVSGWDRTVFLWYVYYVRWRLLNLPPEYEEQYWYIVYHTIFPTAITPEGLIVMRQTGNNSGGNNTASDNSIAHLIVIMYFFIKSYYEKHQRLLRLTEILDNAYVGIYSDDQTGSCNHSFFGWNGAEDYMEDKIRAYDDWGLIIKPKATLVTIEPPGTRLSKEHEFLGSYFHYDHDVMRYLPYPRLGKICASITRIPLNELDEIEFFERALALTFLSYPAPLYFDILVKYLEYLYDISTYKGALRHVLFVNDLSLMKLSFQRLHLGWEACTNTASTQSSFMKWLIFFSSSGGGGFKTGMNVKKNTTTTVTTRPRNRKAKTTVVRETIKSVPETKKQAKKSLGQTKVVAKDGGFVTVQKVPGCTAHFASALVIPHDTPPGVCMPSATMTYPSLKEKGYCSGSFQIGANGSGYIAGRLGCANDVGYIQMTQSSSVGSGGTALNAFTNIMTANFANLSYSQAQFSSINVMGRPVAGGVRVRYVGSLMNQNGIAYCHTDVDHSSVMSQTFASMTNLQETRKVIITGTMAAGDQWTAQVNDNGPATYNEWDFNPVDAPQSQPYFCILLSGLPGDTYTFEACCHVELVGKALPNETVSHTDPINTPLIQDVQRQAFSEGPPQAKDTKGIFHKMIEAVGEYGPKLAKKLLGGGMSFVPSVVQGLMALTPMTGGNPLIANQGFSQPSLMYSDAYSKHRALAGNYRGSNISKPKDEQWLDDFAKACVAANYSPSEIIDILQKVTGTRRVVRNPGPTYEDRMEQAIAAQKAAFGSFKSFSLEELNGTDSPSNKRSRDSGSYDS